MRTLPANVVLEQFKRNTPFAWLALLDIELTNGNDFHIVRNVQDVSFLSDEYASAGCVAFWKMNDALATDDVVEEVGTIGNGALVGGDDTVDVSVAGKINEAFDLDGAHYVDTGDSFESTFQGSYSISIWMKPDEGQPGTAQVVFGYEDHPVSNQNRLDLTLMTDGTLRVMYYSDGEHGKDAITDVPVFLSGEADWTHVVIVLDSIIGGVGGKEIYVNGVKQVLDSTNNGSTVGVDFSAFDIGENLVFGCFNDDGVKGFHYSGLLDSMCIFNRVLSQADVDVVFNAKSDYTVAKCVAHWKCDDYDDGLGVYDSAGVSDGNLIGANTEDVSVAGKIRDAFHYDGSTISVDCEDPYQSTLRSSFSFAGWFNADDGVPSTWSNIIGARDTSGSNSYTTLRLGTSGQINFQYQSEENTEVFLESTTTYTNSVKTGWHFVVVTITVDGDDAVGRLYIDSVLEDTDSQASVMMGSYSTAQDLHMGVWNDNGVIEYFWEGELDNIMIFNRALAQADITFLYNNGNGTDLMPNTEGAGTELVPVVYTAYPFNIETQNQDLNGQIRTLSISVSNVGRLLEADIDELDGASGSTVRIRIVNSGIITEDYSDLILEYELLSTQVSDQEMKFELGMPSILKERFPLWRYMALICVHTYTGGLLANALIYPECGYVGAELTCDKTLSGTDGCIAHSNETRYGGKPGLRRGGIRLV